LALTAPAALETPTLLLFISLSHAAGSYFAGQGMR
jgi:hypothetical protein